jgi:colanic acid/amylovoran biosynthesis glycosyltransferase
MQCGELSRRRRMPGGDVPFASIIAPAPPNRSAQFACKPVWRRSRRFSFSFTNHGPAEFFEMSRWWLSEKVRRALFVVCISSFCRSQMMVAAAVEDWSKLRIVHCGVDPKLFDVKRHEKRGRRLLFVGRLAPEKGCAVLLDTVAELPDAILDVVGDGPSLESLRRKAADLRIGERVVFHGYLNESGVRS